LYPSAALAAAMTGVRFWRAATATGVVLSGVLFVQAAAAPFAVPRKLDFSLIRLAGWDTLARDAGRLAASTGATFIAADEYGLASELAFRLPGRVVGVEPRWALVRLPAATALGPCGLLIRSTRRASPLNPAEWPGAVRIGELSRGRYGITAETYAVYRVAPPLGVAAVRLPAPG
jgi:hypothetical protein